MDFSTHCAIIDSDPIQFYFPYLSLVIIIIQIGIPIQNWEKKRNETKWKTERKKAADEKWERERERQG